jgi:hypothetical protein
MARQHGWAIIAAAALLDESGKVAPFIGSVD